MNSRFKIIALLFAAFFFSCSSNKWRHTHQSDLFISYDKSGCFGECPTYKMTLTGDRSLNRIGIRHVDFLGSSFTKINRKNMNEIESYIRDISRDKLKPQYMTGYSDLPSITFQYSIMPGDTTTVIFEKQLAPKPIIEIVHILDQIIHEKGWEIK